MKENEVEDDGNELDKDPLENNENFGMKDSSDIKIYKTLLAKKRKATIRPTIIKEIKLPQIENLIESTNIRGSDGNITLRRFNVRTSMYVKSGETITAESEDGLFETLWRNSDLSSIVNNASKMMSFDKDSKNSDKSNEEHKKVANEKKYGTMNANSLKKEMREFKKDNSLPEKKKFDTLTNTRRDVSLPKLKSQMGLKDFIKTNTHLQDMMLMNMMGKRLFGRKLEELVNENDHGKKIKKKLFFECEKKIKNKKLKN